MAEIAIPEGQKGASAMEDRNQGFRGSIVGIELSDLIQLLCTSTTGYLKIRVKSDTNEGAICISGGNIVHAQSLSKEGEEAFYEILSWAKGEFAVSPTDPEMIGKISIHKPWQQLILESARLKDEQFVRQTKGSGISDDKFPIYCDNCEKRFYVSSDKIPFGKKLKIRCPSCQHIIDVEREETTEHSFETEIERWKREEFMTEDIFLDGREGVLICSSDNNTVDILSKRFSEDDYNVRVAKTGREGFKYLREGIFQLVILDENLGQAGTHEHGVLLFYIQKLPMNIRRRFFLCLLSSSLKTRDQWAAFRLGVDLIVNKSSLEIISDLLHYSVTQKRRFYAPFMEELQMLRAS